jgi:hypothetical protein
MRELLSNLFLKGADGTLGLQAAEIMMVMAKNGAKEWRLRDQVHVSGPYGWIYNRLSFAIIRACSSSCMRGYHGTDCAPMVYHDYVYWRPSMGVQVSGSR